MERHDPLTPLYFRLDLGSLGVVDFLECTGLKGETEVVEYEEGGENTFVHKFRTRTKYTPITLKRGITRGAKDLWDWRDSAARRTKPVPRDGAIIVLDDAMHEVMRWRFVRGWPMRLTGPDLKGDQSGIAIDALELAFDDLIFPGEDRKPTPPPKPPIPPPPKPDPVKPVIPGPKVDDSIKANFSFSPLLPKEGDEVSFQDRSTSKKKVTGWAWSCKDAGFNASEQHPKHKFPKAGDFVVELKATNEAGKSDTTKLTVKVAPETINAAFNAAPLKAIQGEKIQLTDRSGSSCKITKWEWSANKEGWKSTDQSPTAEFKELGVQTLTLKVTNEKGKTDSTTRDVEVIEKLKVDFSFSPASVKPGEKTSFKDESVCSAKLEKWEWSCPTQENWKGTEQHPGPSFKKPGKHKVTLKVTTANKTTGEATKEIEVKDNCPEFATLHFEFKQDANPNYANRYTFSLVPEKGPNGENFAFIDWDFGEQLEALGTREVHQKKKHMLSFPKKGDTYVVKCGVRLQGYEDCWYVMEKQIVAAQTKSGKSPNATKKPYEKPQGTLKNKL